MIQVPATAFLGVPPRVPQADVSRADRLMTLRPWRVWCKRHMARLRRWVYRIRRWL